MPYVGLAALELAAPLDYLIMAPLVYVGAFDHTLTGSLRSFGGPPALAASVRRLIGPVDLKVTGTIPTAFLIVPWYADGAQLTLEAGLAF